MSEDDLLRSAEAKRNVGTSTRDGRNISSADAGDEVAQKLMAHLEPTKFVASALFEHAPIAMLMVDQTGKIKHINNATVQLFGYSKEALVGEPIEILVPSEARPRHEQFRKDFMTHPTSRPMAEGRRLTARKKDGTEVPVDIALNPIPMGASEVAVVLSVIDVSPRERAELAELFVTELTHRAKNMFAIIGAISRQISRYTSTFSEFQSALERRLNSLSTSYQVFEKQNWRAAPISDLVRSQISFVVKQDTPQIEIAGPEIRLQATPAEYLGLAIHELATNAVKHGALSVPTGKIFIHWSVDENEKVFQFHWTEHNGPPFTPSERRGFGFVMLKSIVPAACGGTADLVIGPTGMSWNLNGPVAILARFDS